MRPILTAIGALLFVGLVRAQPALLLLSVLLLLAVAVSAVWARLAPQGLSYRRFFDPPRIFPGQESDYVVEIVNRKRLPLPWTEITDRLPAALVPTSQESARPGEGEWRRQSTIAIGWNERVVLRQRITCQQRGEYLVGPTDIETGDPLGLFPHNLHIPARPALLVYPRIARLESAAPRSRFPFGTTSARPPVLEDPSWFAGIRDYRPGDPRRWVDWKATARRLQLQTRVFTPTTFTTVVVALNVQTMPFTWLGHDREKLEGAIGVAAALVRDLLAAKGAVGLAVNGSGLGIEGFQVFSPPSRKASQYTDILATLGRLTPMPTLAFSRLLRRVASHFPYGASLAVVAGFLDQESADELGALVERGHAVSLWYVGTELPCRLPPRISLTLVPEVTLEAVEVASA